MKPGEKLILPLWFRTGLVVALMATLYFSFTHRIVDDAGYRHVAADDQRQALSSQKLRFIDGEQGTIKVIDANNEREITQLQKGEDGFMRSVMRGFVRERKAQGLGPEMPFELTLWEDGLLSLIDPATSRRVELSAFGIDNVKAFSRLLPGGDQTVNRSSVSSS